MFVLHLDLGRGSSVPFCPDANSTNNTGILAASICFRLIKFRASINCLGLFELSKAFFNSCRVRISPVSSSGALEQEARMTIKERLAKKFIHFQSLPNSLLKLAFWKFSICR